MEKAKWREQAIATIIRNREALGLSTESTLINNLFILNTARPINELTSGGWIVSDGLIVGKDSELEVKSND
jgi:hypothetical protein